MQPPSPGSGTIVIYVPAVGISARLRWDPARLRSRDDSCHAMPLASGDQGRNSRISGRDRIATSLRRSAARGLYDNSMIWRRSVATYQEPERSRPRLRLLKIFGGCHTPRSFRSIAVAAPPFESKRARRECTSSPFLQWDESQLKHWPGNFRNARIELPTYWV